MGRKNRGIISRLLLLGFLSLASAPILRLLLWLVLLTIVWLNWRLLCKCTLTCIFKSQCWHSWTLGERKVKHRPRCLKSWWQNGPFWHVSPGWSRPLGANTGFRASAWWHWGRWVVRLLLDYSAPFYGLLYLLGTGSTVSSYCKQSSAGIAIGF